jgi:hypothetical protein
MFTVNVSVSDDVNSTVEYSHGDRFEVVVENDDVGRFLRHFAATAHRKADVCFLQRSTMKSKRQS